jgi:hypothetical protein
LNIFPLLAFIAKNSIQNLKKDIIEEYDKNFEFIYQPYLLRAQNIIFFNALYLAADQGRYFDLIDRIFIDSLSSAPLKRTELFKHLQDLGLGTGETLIKIKNGFYDDSIYTPKKNNRIRN